MGVNSTIGVAVKCVDIYSTTNREANLQRLF